MNFLDTSAIYALAGANDPNHGRAVASFRHARGTQEEVLVHSFILVESPALLQRRLGPDPAVRFLRESERCTTHWVMAQDHVDAVELLRDRGRRGLSLVDCTSFIVMRRYQLTHALAFDGDFQQEGFTLYRDTLP